MTNRLRCTVRMFGVDKVAVPAACEGVGSCLVESVSIRWHVDEMAGTPELIQFQSITHQSGNWREGPSINDVRTEKDRGGLPKS